MSRHQRPPKRRSSRSLLGYALLLGTVLVGTQASAQGFIEDTITWGGWNADLAGPAARSVALVVQPPDRSTVLTVDGGGTLRWRHWNGSQWTPWTVAAVPPVPLDPGNFDAIAIDRNRIQVAARDRDGHVRTIWGEVDGRTNRWAAWWEDHGGSFGPPALVKGSGDRVYMFATQRIVYWKRWEDGAWLDDNWSLIEGNSGGVGYPLMRSPESGETPTFVGPLAAAKSPDSERIDLIGLTTDGRVVQTYWNGRFWAGYADLSGTLRGQFSGGLAVTAPAPRRLEFYVHAEDGTIHRRRWNDQWYDGDWTAMTAADTRGDIDAAALSDCRTDLIARNRTNGVSYGYTRCEDDDIALDVRITLREVRVHDDCDNVSAGDWFIGFAAATEAMVSRTEAPPQFVFPNRDEAVDVDTGDTLQVGQGLPTLQDVDRTQSLFLGVDAVDCDGDSTFTFGLPNVVVPTPLETAGRSLFALLSVDCSWEEEELEWSGDDDPLGGDIVALTPGQWQHGGSFEVAAKTPIESGCFSGGVASRDGFGPSAYTAVFDVRTTRRRR